VGVRRRRWEEGGANDGEERWNAIAVVDVVVGGEDEAERHAAKMRIGGRCMSSGRQDVTIVAVSFNRYGSSVWRSDDGDGRAAADPAGRRATTGATAAAATTFSAMTTTTMPIAERERTTHHWTMVRGRESGGWVTM